MTEKADRAKELLENPVFQEALENLRIKYVAMLADAPVNSSKENVVLLLDLKKMLRLLDDIEAELQDVIRDGYMEDFKRAQEEQLAFNGDINGRKH